MCMEERLQGNPVSEGIAYAKSYIYIPGTLTKAPGFFPKGQEEEKYREFRESCEKADSELVTLYNGMCKEDPDKAADSRYIHRGAFQWELAGKRKSKTSVEGQIFQTLDRMEQIRRQESVFDKDCDVYTYDVHDDSILCILRQKGDDRFIGIFNFSDSEKTAWMQEEGTFRDLITDQTLELKDVELPAYGFMWCKRM